MKTLKKSVALLVVFAMVLSLAVCTTIVHAEERTFSATNIVRVDLLNRTHAFKKNSTSLTENSIFTQSYTKDGVNYNFDKVGAVEIPVGNIDDAFEVKLSFYNYWEKPTSNCVEVYAVSGCTFDSSDYEATADSINGAEQTLVGTLGTSSAHNNTDRIRVVSLDPMLLRDFIDNDGNVQLIVRVKNTGGKWTTELNNTIFGNVSLTVVPDVAPEIDAYAVLGTPVEGFELKADYEFYSDLHDEGETVIDWLCADSADGDNETVISPDGGKTLRIESEYVDKFIRAKITPYSDEGLYVKGGEEHLNVYYTDYIGPVRSVAYLDELASAIGEECVTTDDLYSYLETYEDIFKLGIEELSSISKSEQVLSNILSNPPVSFAELKNKYKNEFITVKIEEADKNDIEELLSQTDIDLSVYEEIEDSDFVLDSLEAETFESYQNLENAFAKYVAGAQIKEETSSEKLAVMIMNCAPYFTADIEEYSYGEILYTSRYIVETDRTSITNFEALDALISEALEYGKDNYTGGYIISKKNFVEEFCIKSNYSENANGANSVLTSAASYRLFGNINADNYTQQLFLKLDISDLLDYHVQSVNIGLYGTVGGGADKIVEIVSADGIESADDFMEKYPTGVDFERGETLAKVKYSYGTTKWNKADITDFILEKAENGDDYVYLLIDYTGGTQGTVVSKGATIYSISSGAERAPYVEIIYETPPIVKNIEISGIKAAGSTVTAQYDYFGCYVEEGTVFSWYMADKNGDNYENKTLISTGTSPSLGLKAAHAGKCIMVEVKPGSSDGAYREGEFTPSEYTLPVLSTQEASSLTAELNDAADILTVLGDSVKAQYLDVDAEDDMQSLETEGKAKVLSILANVRFTDLNHFKRYYAQMINVQVINEAEYDEIDTLIKTSDTGTDTQRYASFEDNTSILDAVSGKAFESVEAYQKAFNEACAVYEFKTVTHKNVKELLLAYDFMFTQDVESMGESKIDLVGNYFMTEIQNKKGSFSLIQSALTNAVTKASNNKPGVSTGGGGGGGSSSGGKVVSVPANPATSVGTVTPSVSNKKYTDLAPVSSWAEESILKLSEEGILSGDGSGNFRPNDNITREEFIKVAVVAFGITAEGETSFADVADDAWYKKYVNTAVSAGIINGVGDNLFGAGTEISREDMCTILYRIMLAKGMVTENEGESAFADETDIAQYAKNAVNALSGKGIVNGMGDNNFMPKGKASRAMVAVMIDRALGAEN